MAFISISDLKPTKISRDLKGKFVLLYGKPKSGKTSMASEFPRNFLMATEVGYHDIPNIIAANIDSWATFKKYLRELGFDETKEQFDTITIDTISLLWDLCEKYICQQNDVQGLGDIPWGKGYTLAVREFTEALRKITLLGYGLVLIAHSETRTEKADDGSEIEFIGPALNKRAYQIVNQLVDLIGYISSDFDKDGNSVRNIHTRATPTLMAGSRFKYLKPIIPLDYQELANALVDAVEKRGEEAGVQVIDERLMDEVKPMRPFDEVMAEAKELFLSLANDDKKLELVNKSIKEWFGNELFRLSEAQPSQQELVENVIADMKSIK